VCVVAENGQFLAAAAVFLFLFFWLAAKGGRERSLVKLE